MDLEALLEEQGCKSVEAANGVARALDVLEKRPPDAATLDMNLNGESSAPVAAALQERGIPFVVVTGYGDDCRNDPAYRDAPLLKKPYNSDELIRRLVHLLT